MYSYHFKAMGTFLLMLAGGSLYADANPQTAPLWPELGSYHYRITTSKTEAQRYFDQGLKLAFGFNHAEAARSFQAAYAADPDCAMCYWGEALVLGPNINAPMGPDSAGRAAALVRQAQQHDRSATDSERELIEALSERYADTASADRKKLDVAYGERMRKTFRRFSDNALIAALTAEALMDLHPWNFWSKQGQIKPWTGDIIALLEQALALDPNHPLANHLYIHALEASPHPEKALESARRLPGLMPGSGHLVHMPAHIYIRMGRYHDAILANQDAVKVDSDYLAHEHAESLYTHAYVPHNHHFLWSAAVKTGRKSLAAQAAREAAEKIDQTLLRAPGFSGTMQHFALLPLYTEAAFGEWSAILQRPNPPGDLLYVAAATHYARGLALLKTGKVNEAKQELKRLEKIAEKPELASLTVFDLNPVKTLLQIGIAILHGEMAASEKRFSDAVIYLQEAVKLEDGLNYTEPKDWYLPPRQVLGAILMLAGNSGQAERVYRQDLVYHPQNGWSLFGLMQSLEAQHKESETVWRHYRTIWDQADTVLKSSAF